MDIVLLVLAILFLLFSFVVFFGAPYVPSLKKDMNKAFDELYTIKKADVVLDVGSGDGVVLREISKRGGKAIGYEINPVLVLLSHFFWRKDSNVKVQWKNFWTTPFPKDTTLVYAFAVSRDVKRLEQKMQQESNKLKRVVYLISYGSELGHILPKKQAGAHHLYEFKPLQIKKPQV
jgi:hypothetical protein